MAHVFISYEKTDRAVAENICQYLEKQGLQCWIAPRNVLAGKEWDESIVEAIKTSGCMVLVFSSQADGSRQVKRELNIADNHEVPIIPCRIKNEEPAKLAYFLTIAHWFDAFESSLEHHLPQLLTTITSHVPDLKGKPPTPTPPEPPLPPEKKKGRLLVNTEPQNAVVKILNLRGQFTQGMELEPESYHVEVAADGFETKREWIDLGAGEDKQINIILTKIKAPPKEPAKRPTEREAPEAKEFTNSLGMKFVLIPAGTFLMGSPSSEPDRKEDEAQHQVTISRPFYLQTTPVTQGQWQRVMGDNPSKFKDCGENCPVEKVSWNDIQKFLTILNEMENTDSYRLPTEAEWEYACRAGSTTKWCFGDNEAKLKEYAWYDENSGDKTNPVGKKKPNAWGLYDMHGNVWEWCQDWYGDYPPGPLTDPKGGPEPGFWKKLTGGRVLRGGSWGFNARLIRSANRNGDNPDGRDDYYFGFRVARAL